MSEYVQSPLNKFRKDRFIMVIPVPIGLREIVKKNTRTNLTTIPDAFSFSIYGTIAPDITVPEKIQGYSGQSLKVSSHARTPYPNLVVNFTIDNRFNNYWFIYKWLDVLNDDKQSAYDSKEVTDVTKFTVDKILPQYSTIISVFALDEYDKRVVEFKYTYAFPTRLSGITLNNRDSSEAEATMEFAYGQFFCSLVEQAENL